MAFGEEIGPDTLAINRSVTAVSTACVELTTDEGSWLMVRSRGAVVTALALRAQQTQEIVPVLHCDTAPTNASSPKPRASHAMVPVGPDGSGGNHGFPRYADYEYLVDQQNNTLLAQMRYYGPTIPKFERRLTLGATILMTKDTLTARSLGYATSMGQHNYHAVPNGALSELRVNGQSLPEVLQDPDAIAKIEDGQAQFWPGFNGGATFSHPTEAGERKFYVNAATQVTDAGGERRLSPQTTGVLFWRGTGENYLAIEPVVGVSVTPEGAFHNEGLGIAPFGTATFLTTIGVIS